MVYDPERHARRSIRLPDYDYALPGGYFVTVCTHNRRCLFGAIEDHAVRLNAFGTIARDQLLGLPNHYPHVQVDAWVIMPNHLHAIIILRAYDPPSAVGAGLETRPSAPQSDPLPAPPKRHALPEVVRGFKTYSARAINDLRQSPGVPIWQRSFYDRVIRDEREWQTFRWYIAQNPLRWAKDRDNPANDAT